MANKLRSQKDLLLYVPHHFSEDAEQQRLSHNISLPLRWVLSPTEIQ